MKKLVSYTKIPLLIVVSGIVKLEEIQLISNENKMLH